MDTYAQIHIRVKLFGGGGGGGNADVDPTQTIGGNISPHPPRVSAPLPVTQVEVCTMYA